MTPVDLEDLRIKERPGRRAGGRAVIVLVILLPVALAAGWMLRGRGGVPLGGPVAVRVATVREPGRAGSRSAALTEGGWIEVPSYHPILVSALIPGRVEEMTVLEGSSVKKGQLVARLYAKDLADTLRLAEAEVSEARSALDLLRAGYRKEEIKKATAELLRLQEEARLAGTILARTRELVPSGAASREDLERDEAALRVAEARVQAAREELNRLEAGFRKEEVAKAEATLARAEAARDLASKRLSYAEVRSPADGVVLERFITAGTSLRPEKLEVVSLYDPNDLQARVDVRQTNAGQVFPGQRAEVTTEAEPGVIYRGRVIRVDPLADLKKNTVQAKIKIEEPGPGLHPEMICRARFLPREEKAAAEAAPRHPTLPAAAVLNEDGRTFVFLVADGRAKRTEVRLGEERDGRFEVVAGVKPGDRVVLSPPAGLTDGSEITEQKSS